MLFFKCFSSREIICITVCVALREHCGFVWVCVSECVCVCVRMCASAVWLQTLVIFVRTKLKTPSAQHLHTHHHNYNWLWPLKGSARHSTCPLGVTVSPLASSLKQTSRLSSNYATCSDKQLFFFYPLWSQFRLTTNKEAAGWGIQVCIHR